MQNKDVRSMMCLQYMLTSTVAPCMIQTLTIQTLCPSGFAKVLRFSGAGKECQPVKCANKNVQLLSCFGGPLL